MSKIEWQYQLYLNKASDRLRERLFAGSLARLVRLHVPMPAAHDSDFCSFAVLQCKSESFPTLFCFFKIFFFFFEYSGSFEISYEFSNGFFCFFQE